MHRVELSRMLHRHLVELKAYVVGHAAGFAFHRILAWWKGRKKK